MFKKEITYEDYNGVERTETFYFNLTQTELTKMQTSMPGGGMAEYMESISAKKDVPKMMDFFNLLILKSYGEKSQDGRRLIKGDDDELAKAFMETPAYDILFRDIFTSENGMVDFVAGII